MPDLLIVTSDHALSSAIEERARNHNFRTKTALDAAGAMDWLKNWSFDIVCVDPKMPLAEQERIADLLWREQSAAPFVLVDLYSHSRSPIEARLFGADVVRGESALKALDNLFERAKPQRAMRLDQFKVLVVDDLDSPRDIICALLETMGVAEVIGVGSAKEALELLTREPERFSCVLTDLRMPDVKGDMLIEQVRKDPRLLHLPVIVLTAYGSADTLISCLRAGASGFLVKPPKKTDLTREIGRAYRIFHRGASPRLASPEEAEALRAILEQRGFS